MSENNPSKQKIKQNKLVGAILTITILIVALSFIIPFATDQSRPTSKFHNGTITGVDKTEANARVPETRLLVTLGDGTVVKVVATDMGDWQIGKRITVEEFSSMRFSIKKYKFVKYNESPIKN